ncbi:MAG: hypothetical protein H6551_05550 [Chitinophagales bacterium]|nr:hypothetical protein [Chitinophagaceae bacterium]MCB9064595.1 hypothetical protein [Chitinophagales bacterium]
MKWTSIAAVLTVSIILHACSTSKKTAKSTKTQIGDAVTEMAEPVSNITLSDKSLSEIQKHLIGPKWQMLYKVGGLTGGDREEYQNIYITFHKDHIMRYTGDAGKKQPAKWEYQRDIFTGDSVIVISGFENWKVNAIENDTLRLSDNYYDGYGYSLIRSR